MVSLGSKIGGLISGQVFLSSGLNSRPLLYMYLIKWNVGQTFFGKKSYIEWIFNVVNKMYTCVDKIQSNFKTTFR